ncbi:MAG: hypothetical protein M3Q32_02470, partial [Pseudomonadota bacterium]|nr:hypothetical protein [Pseudomonadota bacterium]
ADVVQQAGQMRFFGMHVLRELSQPFCDGSRVRGMPPQTFRFGSPNWRLRFEYLGDRGADCNRPDGVEPKCHDALFERNDLSRLLVAQGVGQCNDSVAQRNVEIDQTAQVSDINPLAIESPQHLQQDVRERRQCCACYPFP